MITNNFFEILGPSCEHQLRLMNPKQSFAFTEYNKQNWKWSLSTWKALKFLLWYSTVKYLKHACFINFTWGRNLKEFCGFCALWKVGNVNMNAERKNFMVWLKVKSSLTLFYYIHWEQFSYRKQATSEASIQHFNIFSIDNNSKMLKNSVLVLPRWVIINKSSF